MAVLAGSAAIAIAPDFRGFLAKTQAGIKSELSSLDPTVNVKADLDAGSVAKIKAELGLLGGADAPLKFALDPGSVAKARAALGTLAAGKSIPLKFDVDPASVVKARAALGALAGDTVPVEFGIDQASLLKTQQAARIFVTNTKGATIPVYADMQTVSFERVEAAAKVMTSLPIVQQVKFDANPAGLVAADVATKALASDTGRAAGAATGAGRAYRGWLGGSVPLFGSATHSVGVWHIALDAAIEGVIAVGGALAVLTATAYAFWPAAVDVYNHLNAVDSANDALGSSIPPLAKHFVALQQSLAPEALELYGGALNVVNRSAGLLSPAIHSVASLMEGWIANIDIWVGSQRTMGGLLQSGVGYLSQFGSLVGDVGLAIVNLLSKDPGVVHFLLDVVGGAGKLLVLFSDLPRPIVEATLALHGIYLWGGLAVTALTRVGTGVASMVKSVAGFDGLLGSGKLLAAGLTTGTVIAFAALAAAIAYAGYESTQATPEVRKFIGGINSQVAGMTASQAVLGGIATAIGSVNREIQGQNLASVMKGWNDIGPMGSQWATSIGDDTRATISQFGSSFGDLAKGLGPSGTWADLGHAVTGFGLAVKDAFVPGAGASIALKNNIAALNTEINSLLGTGKNMDAEVGTLMRGTTSWSYVVGEGTGKVRQLGSGLVETTTGAYTFNQALALMDLAGVKSTDSLTVMRQKVDNLIEGYREMGVRGGILANAVDAVTLSMEEQQSKASNLTQAYTTFIGLVTGSESAFTTFAQGIGTLSKDAAAGKTSLQGIAQASSSLASAQARVASAQSSLSGLQKSGKASADSLSAAHDRLTAAEDSLAGAQGKASAASKTQAVSLNGLSASSLTLRSTWNGSITDAVSLYNAMLLQTQAAGMGSKGYGLLTQAGKDMAASMLPLAKGSSAATAELYALAQVAGYQGPDAFRSLAAWVGKVHDPMANLDSIESKLTVASADLATDTKNLAAAISQNLNQAMSQAIFIASGGQKAYTNFAEAVMKAHGNTSAMIPTARSLAKELVTQTHNVSDAHKEFDVFAIGLGLNRQQADKLWDSLHLNDQALAGMPGKVDPAKKSIAGLGTAFRNLGTDMKDPGSSFSGINFQSDVLQGTLSGRLLPSLQKVVSEMESGSAPAHALAQVIATELNPAAKDGALKNDSLRTAIYNMAEQAGYAGADKIRPLSAWLQNNATSLGNAMAAAKLYGDAIAKDGSQSDAARGARTRLINDLIATGKAAQDSTSQIASMIARVVHIPVKRALEIVMTGDGSYKITGTGFPTLSGHAKTGLGGAELAAGGRIPGYGGGDKVPAMLEPGETVVPKHLTPFVAPLMKAHNVPGFSAGGLVDQGNAAVLSGQYAVNMSSQFATDMASSMVTAMKTAVTAAASAASLAFPSPAAAGTGTAQAIAQRLLATMGWSGQWPALDYLWTRESGWNYLATNPSSGAYGIPQSLPADKMAAAGSDWRTDPATQIRWGLGYIKSVYGSPDAAAAHEQSHGWYDQGINGPWLPPGLSLAANMTGKPEAVVRPDQLVKLAQGGGGDTNYIANFPDAWAAGALQSQVRAAFTAMSVNDTRKARLGRQQ
jgi:hypothetical protein